MPPINQYNRAEGVGPIIFFSFRFRSRSNHIVFFIFFYRKVVVKKVFKLLQILLIEYQFTFHEFKLPFSNSLVNDSVCHSRNSFVRYIGKVSVKHRLYDAVGDRLNHRGKFFCQTPVRIYPPSASYFILNSLHNRERCHFRLREL